MRQLNHENINGFVGACLDPPKMCILSNYCSRGCLQVSQGPRLMTDTQHSTLRIHTPHSRFPTQIFECRLMYKTHTHHSENRSVECEKLSVLVTTLKTPFVTMGDPKSDRWRYLVCQFYCP